MFALDGNFTKKGTKRQRKKYLQKKEAREACKKNKIRQIHSVRLPCKCKKLCFQKFTEQLRNEINEKYWNKNYTERKSFLNNMVESLPVLRRRSKSAEVKKTQQKSIILKTKLAKG